MRIFIECECELLQASLTNFLPDSQSSEKGADFIICDSLVLSDKPTFIVGNDIKLPFTKAQLLAKLDEFIIKNKLDKKDFECELEAILDRFKHDLLELFKNAK